ncbi:reverse transcriptase family protein [Streptomyces achromogenes]|uniref:reverse transcriptase family protein n=1 Tax=Streptomyces achromogenes TaxID=67255 RepID=UPI003693D053
MITDSPHKYRSAGLQRGVPEPVIDNALLQSQTVESAGLASVLTLGHLARRTGLSHRYLRSIVARDRDPYLSFQIKKKSSTRARVISTPRPSLMHAQRWILRNILSRVQPHQNSYAYYRGRSVLDCARKHLGAEWIIKLDFHNFFETVTESQVFQVFEGLGYEPLPSLELSRVCTRYAAAVNHLDLQRYLAAKDKYRVIHAYKAPYLGFLPQGAPTSGALANLVARKLDQRLSNMANNAGLVYTRYADDLVFSSGHRFSRDLARGAIGRISREIGNAGFVVHERKTRVIPPGGRKLVLGLLVDGDEVRLSREFRMRINNHVRGVEKFGLGEHCGHRGFSSMHGLVAHVSGLIAHADSVSPDWAQVVRTRWNSALAKSGWDFVDYGFRSG